MVGAKNPTVSEMINALSSLPPDAELMISSDTCPDVQIHVFPMGESRGMSGLLWDQFDGFVRRDRW